MAEKRNFGKRFLNFEFYSNKYFAKNFLLFICWVLGAANIFSQEIVIEVAGKKPENSYLTWVPKPARIALSSESQSDLKVTLRTSKRTADRHQGEVVFASRPLEVERVSAEDFSPLDSLELSLPKNGEWVSFFVAGKFGFPSADPGDVEIIVESDEGEVARFDTMVRVRKNAENLQQNERRRLLKALAEFHDVKNASANSKYAKYPAVHSAAWDMAHGGPAFLPWHRAYILALERELQAIDPAVSLHYWKFDAASVRVFTPDFMGAAGGGPFGRDVSFQTGNEIGNWEMGSLGRLKERRPGDGTNGGDSILSLDTIIRFNPEYARFFGALEGNHHNGAHTVFGGWLASGHSPADPSFFLLHSNVDRAWAKWQTKYGAFNSNDIVSYHRQGKWEDSGTNTPKGHYSEDSLWPWDGDTSTANGRYSLDDINWLGFDQPSSIRFPQRSGHGPSTVPLLKEMIDYLDVAGDGGDLGFCYDSVPFKE